MPTIAVMLTSAMSDAEAAALEAPLRYRSAPRSLLAELAGLLVETMRAGAVEAAARRALRLLDRWAKQPRLRPQKLVQVPVYLK